MVRKSRAVKQLDVPRGAGATQEQQLPNAVTVNLSNADYDRLVLIAGRRRLRTAQVARVGLCEWLDQQKAS